MIVIILAAGKGKRMQPLTETRLKGSLPIRNKSLLIKLTEMIENSGLMDELILVISPFQKQAMEELFSKEPYAAKIKFAIQDPPKGTGDALAQAEQFIGNYDRCLVLNGDIIAHIEDILPELIAHHERLEAQCTIVVYPGKSERYGLLQITPDGRVLDIKEKILTEEIKDNIGYINAGIYLFQKEIFDAIRETPLSKRGEYEITDAIALLGKRGPLGALITDSWMSIENPADLFTAQRFFPPSNNEISMQFHSGGEIGFKAAKDIFFDEESEIEFSSVFFKGPVLVGKGTLIETGSKIGPDVYIGRDCEIGAEAVLDHILLMDNCRIGSNCELSYLLAAEDIVIGQNTRVKPKRVSISDERDPKDFVIVGGKTIITSNVSINEGIKIEAHSVVRKDD